MRSTSVVTCFHNHDGVSRLPSCLFMHWSPQEVVAERLLQCDEMADETMSRPLHSFEFAESPARKEPKVQTCKDTRTIQLKVRKLFSKGQGTASDRLSGMIPCGSGLGAFGVGISIDVQHSKILGAGSPTLCSIGNTGENISGHLT